MSKDTGAWMPFYVGDYLGDTQRLTTEQHGAYLLLILDYWRNGPAPDDDAVLQQICKLAPASWKRHRAALARLFQVEAGEWRHKRIDRELKAAAKNAERRSAKASAAANARWGKGEASPKHDNGDAPSMPQAMLGECPPPSSSPSPNGDTEEEATRAHDFPTDLIAVTAELCLAGGVRHVDPGHVLRAQQTVTGWLSDGFDPETELLPAVRTGVANATERIGSLAYFDPIIRQARARKEAAEHGHVPRQDQRRYASNPRASEMDDVFRNLGAC